MTRGLQNKPNGESHYRSVLTEEMVRSIRKDYIPRVFTMRECAEKYRKPLGTIRGVILYSTWRHVL